MSWLKGFTRQEVNWLVAGLRVLAAYLDGRAWDPDGIRALVSECGHDPMPDGQAVEDLADRIGHDRGGRKR